ncbi:MAG: type I-F CRISPR-associated endoribonuclease Cas6/Csy4 [Azoarcus sp.]|nr:type I-F CRISPR-associated endoribonuclease Cas6/Csy4 [Azoarcus sp.]
MDHYIDLQLRPDPELAANHIVSAVYTRLHLALAQLHSDDIGVSFPAHDNLKPTLGDLMRLHGPMNSLVGLFERPWLKGLEDHLHLGTIGLVPPNPAHRVVDRVQVKSNVERLRRRAMKRHGLDAATAAERIPESSEERLQLPFVRLGSRSTGQTSFPLFIRHGPLRPNPVSGPFSSYGLSRGATIPWF